MSGSYEDLYSNGGCVTVDTQYRGMVSKKKRRKKKDKKTEIYMRDKLDQEVEIIR